MGVVCHMELGWESNSSRYTEFLRVIWQDLLRYLNYGIVESIEMLELLLL
jgi:hypothetical protein